MKDDGSEVPFAINTGYGAIKSFGLWSNNGLMVNMGDTSLGNVNVNGTITIGTSADGVSSTISDSRYYSNSLCIVGQGILPNRSIYMCDNVFITGALTVATISCSGTITAKSCNCPSDRRLKQNIKELDSVYDSIKKLSPVTYEWKENNESDFGLIAQEYYKIFPFTNKSNLTGEEPIDENGQPKYYSIDYSKLSVILLQGLKETMDILEETRYTLEETKNKLNEQHLYTSRLENIINERLNKLENI